MDRVPAPEPYPVAQPTPTSSATSGHNPALILFGIGGLMVAIGGFLPRAELSVGPIGVVQTKGVAIGLVLIGALMVFRAFQVYSRSSGSGGAAILFVGPAVAFGLLIYEFATAKSDLSNWATTTGAQQLATQFHVPVSEVSSRIQALLSSGQTHVTYKAGLYVALIGAVLSLVAAIWAWMTGRGAQQVPAGPGWATPAPASPGVPLAPNSPAPGAPAAPPPSDWTAPPAGWTAPSTSTPSPPTSPQPPTPQSATPPPPAQPPEEPESFPPPPPAQSG